MSGPKGVRYTVEQLAEMAEARALDEQRTRRAALVKRIEEFAVECAVVAQLTGEPVEVPVAPALPATSDEAATVISRAERALLDAHADLNERRAEFRRVRLADRMRQLAPIEIPETPVEVRDRAASASDGAVPAVSALGARVAEVMESLDPTVELSDHFAELALDLRAASGPRAEVAMRALQEEVARLNRLERRRRADATERATLHARAESIGDRSLADRIALARTIPDAPESDVASLRSAVETAERAHDEAATIAHVTGTVTDVLESLGYEVLPGFETVVAREGVLMSRPGWTHHGVRVRVDGEEIGFDVVRTVIDEERGLSTARDVEAENAWCDDFPEALARLQDNGVRPGAVRQVPAGFVPVPVAAGARQAPAPRQQTTARPKEREL